jgi:hypothetical protein
MAAAERHPIECFFSSAIVASSLRRETTIDADGSHAEICAKIERVPFFNR